jgi:hypothetical protein
MPRITATVRTPAHDASYSLSISVSSTRLLSFSQMVAGLPSRAKPISRSIRSISVGRMVSGLKASESMRSGRA